MPDQQLAIIMALLAYSALSLGLVLQKRGIAWIGWRGKKNRRYFRSLAIWIIGFLVMNLYGVPSAVALKTLPPHVVSSFAAWGIVALVLLSFLILKEPLSPRDGYLALLIVIGILVIQWTDNPPAGNPNASGMMVVIMSLLPLLLAAYGFISSRLTDRAKAVLFALVCGLAAGLMVLFLRLLMLENGYRFSRYFSSQYLYLYALYALISLGALQLALKNGPLMMVGPIQYSATIVYPALASMLVFAHMLNVSQMAAILLIVYGVSGIMRTR